MEKNDLIKTKNKRNNRLDLIRNILMYAYFFLAVQVRTSLLSMSRFVPRQRLIMNNLNLYLVLI